MNSSYKSLTLSIYFLIKRYLSISFFSYICFNRSSLSINSSSYFSFRIYEVSRKSRYWFCHGGSPLVYLIMVSGIGFAMIVSFLVLLMVVIVWWCGNIGDEVYFFIVIEIY